MLPVPISVRGYSVSPQIIPHQTPHSETLTLLATDKSDEKRTVN